MWQFLAAVTIAALPSAAPAAPSVSQCELETTQRVAFRVDNAPRQAIATVVRISFFGPDKDWLADEVVVGAGLDVPIPRIAGLLSPEKVRAVKCVVNGYVDTMEQGGIVELGGAQLGRRTCRERDGLDVDGGPDADVDAVLYGRDWILLQLDLRIIHFFPDQPTNFNGDVFAVTLDRGPEQKITVTGTDPQTASFLFTNLKPGLHQINYGPWSVSDAVTHGSPGYSAGYHNVCVAI